jgi:hypothetical protein
VVVSQLIRLNCLTPRKRHSVLYNIFHLEHKTALADDMDSSIFMRVPAEVRLMIYDILLDDRGNRTISIRSESTEAYKAGGQHRRTSYRVLGGNLLRQSQTTTYHVTSDTDFHPNILAVNRKIYEEASQVLYGNHSFDFGGDVEAIVPFLSDLTTSTRSLIEEISLTKMGSVYTRDFDRCEWRNMCSFISQNVQLRKLVLRVTGGRPSSGWIDVQEYAVADFRTLAGVGFEGVEWIQELIGIRALEELEVIPEIEHCPPSTSSAMSFFQAFSASIEKGFTDYLRSEMLLA